MIRCARTSFVENRSFLDFLENLSYYSRIFFLFLSFTVKGIIPYATDDDEYNRVYNRAYLPT